MSNALVAVSDLEKMASAISGSRLFGQLTQEQAMALMLVAQAEGLHPATAARDYHVIQGRPTLKADAMLARHLATGGTVEWHEYTDQRVSATFTHTAGGSVKLDWDFARAKQAGLGSKDMWLKYPRQMLRARVISEGIKTVNPGVATGFYTPEEVSDFEPAKATRGAKARDMGPAVVVPEEAPAATIAPPEGMTRKEHLDSLCKAAQAAGHTKYTLAWVLKKADVVDADFLTPADYADAVEALTKAAATPKT